MTENNLAVSEVVGYVIILGIVFMSIGIVYTNAIPALDNTERTEHLKNAERSFSVLQNNMDEMIENGVPRRGTEMRLTDGSLSINTGQTEGGREQRTNITVRDSSNNVIYTDDGFTSPVKYTLGQRSIVFENGGVIRSEPGGSGMLEGPGWKLDGDRFIINVIRTTYGGGTIGVQTRAGRGSALIRADSTGIQKVGNLDCTDCKVNVTITSDHSKAWGQYLNASFPDTAEPINDETVSMEIDGLSRIIYTRTNVQLGVQ